MYYNMYGFVRYVCVYNVPHNLGIYVICRTHIMLSHLLGDTTKRCRIKIGTIKRQRSNGNKEKQELEHRATMRMYMSAHALAWCVPILGRKAERTVPFSYTCVLFILQMLPSFWQRYSSWSIIEEFDKYFYN